MGTFVIFTFCVFTVLYFPKNYSLIGIFKNFYWFNIIFFTINTITIIFFSSIYFFLIFFNSSYVHNLYAGNYVIVQLSISGIELFFKLNKLWFSFCLFWVFPFKTFTHFNRRTMQYFFCILKINGFSELTEF